METNPILRKYEKADTQKLYLFMHKLYANV